MTEETLFHEALAKPSAERAAFLDQACAGKPELRAAVEALLAAHGDQDSLLDRPGGMPEAGGSFAFLHAPGQSPTQSFVDRGGAEAATIAPDTVEHRPVASIDTVIAGRYKLEQLLGVGGMGEVWVAQQTEPVKRRVALKLVKAGMDSRAVLQRFEAERQALALMDHPNIAKVLDGGLVGQTAGWRPEAGGNASSLQPPASSLQPFFVMELVNGLPLTKFCDEMKLTPRERLELFVPICQAVQHAHQKGIVHRDLKPVNILVTMIDGRPVPKVIDFGVAKAIGGKLTDESLATQFGAVVGTLEYMAPEQAGFSGQDVDTRADIYSLGVILYELLTGLRPFDGKRFRQAALFDMIRVLLEEEPAKPSTQLSTAEALPFLAATRQTEPKKLMAMLRGELDWVVMKCLEKQRDRRYETASGLARDIERYLADEPVEARPPSLGYRLSKAVRRHRRAVLAFAAMVLVLLAGVLGTSVALWRALAAEELASQRLDAVLLEKEKAKAETLRAMAAEKEAQAVLAFFQEKVLAAGRPEGQDGGQGKHVTLRQAVETAEPALAHAFQDQPLVEAAIRTVLGTTHHYLVEPQAAARQFVRAHQLYALHLGPEHPRTLDALRCLGNAYHDAGLVHEAIPLLEKTHRHNLAKLGAQASETLLSANDLAEAYKAAGRVRDALPLYQEAYGKAEAHFGPRHLLSLMLMNNLGSAYDAAGRQRDALPLFQKAWEGRKAVLGPKHPDTLITMNNLANALREAGDLATALPLLEETLALRQARLGREHAHTLSSMNNLAMGYLEAGQQAKALTLFQETLALRKARLGDRHPDTLRSMNNLAMAYRQGGRMAEALQLWEELLPHHRAVLGPDHPSTLGTMNNLAMAYSDAGRMKEALPLLEQVLARRREKLGADHPDTVTSTGNLGGAYLAAKQPDKAVPLLRAFLAAERKLLGAESLPFARLQTQVAWELLQAGQAAEAESLLRECLSLRQQKEPDAWATFHTQSLLGGALLGQKKYIEAEPVLLAGYQGMKQRATTIPPQGKVRLAEALERLVQLSEAMGRTDEAAAWKKELEPLQASVKQPENKP